VRAVDSREGKVKRKNEPVVEKVAIVVCGFGGCSRRAVFDYGLWISNRQNLTKYWQGKPASGLNCCGGETTKAQGDNNKTPIHHLSTIIVRAELGIFPY
jgi:hypothetical protein